MVVCFAIVRRAFRLTVARAFAPFGALIGIQVAALAIVLVVIRPHAVEGFYLPSWSMSPTFEPGDHVAVNKRRAPQRWDVVVYRRAGGRAVENYCKRVVGLPGERLAFDGTGGVTINGTAVPVPLVLVGRCRAVPEGPGTTFARYRDGQEIHLGDRQLFVIGDNADQSWDSRMDGPADLASVIGVVDLVYWPLPHVKVMGW